MLIDELACDFEQLQGDLRAGPILPVVTAEEIRSYLRPRYDFQQAPTDPQRMQTNFVADAVKENRPPRRHEVVGQLGHVRDAHVRNDVSRVSRARCSTV